MRKRSVVVAIAGLATVAALAGTAHGAIAFYGDRPGAGSAPDILAIQEESTTDALPLFGSPIRSGNALLFFPSNYASSAADGSSDITESTLSMRIVAKPGQFLNQITIREFGEWSLTGAGTSTTFVDASGLLSVTDIAPGSAGTLTSPLTAIGLPFSGGPATDTWEGIVSLNLAGLNLTEILLTFRNTLTTSSELGTTAFIRKSIISGPSVAVEVPAPAAFFGLVGPMGLLAARRRRS